MPSRPAHSGWLPGSWQLPEAGGLSCGGGDQQESQGQNAARGGGGGGGCFHSPTLVPAAAQESAGAARAEGTPVYIAPCKDAAPGGGSLAATLSCRRAYPIRPSRQGEEREKKRLRSSPPFSGEESLGEGRGRWATSPAQRKPTHQGVTWPLLSRGGLKHTHTHTKENKTPVVVVVVVTLRQ